MAKRSDAPNPILPMEGEPSNAYAAFCVYANMGFGRKVAQVERILADMPSGGVGYDAIAAWSRKYEWDRRVVEHDAERQRFVEAEERSALKKSIARIQKERIDRLDVDLRLSDELKYRAMEMLGFPLHEMVEEEKPVLQPDGKTLVVRKIYMPTKWAHKDAATLLKAAVELEKLQLFDEKTAKVKVDEVQAEVAADSLAEWRKQQAESIRSISFAPPPGVMPGSDEGESAEDADDAA